ncbi:hypothetical protein WA158_001021 [Blastocystis sp. Blastoise]
MTENKPQIDNQVSIKLESSVPADGTATVSPNEIKEKSPGEVTLNAEEKAEVERLKKAKFLGEAPLYSTMWQLIYPDLCGKLVSACYTLCDAMFIGNMAGDTAAERAVSLAAVSFAMPFEQAFIAGFALFGSIGFGSLYSRFLGEANTKMARRTLGNCYLLAVVIGIFCPLVLLPLAKYLIQFFGASDEAGTLQPATNYLSVLLCFDIFQNGMFVGNNMTRAEGASKYSALMMIIGAVINCCLDPLFISTFRLSLTGAALASVCGNFVVSIVGIYYFLSGRSVVTFDKACWKPSKKVLGVSLNIGSSALISSFCGAIVSIISNRLILYFAPGDPNSVETTEVIAVSGALAKFSFFVFLPMLSMSHGILPIVSFCRGSKNYKRFNQAVKACFYVSVLMGLLLCILGYILAPYVALCFSSSPSFVSTFTFAMRHMTSAIPVNSVITAVMPALQACGHGGAATLLMFGRQCLFILVAEVIICFSQKTFWGCFMAYPIADLFTAFLSLLLYLYYYKDFHGIAQVKKASSKDETIVHVEKSTQLPPQPTIDREESIPNSPLANN